jgi:putative restriction endonuclease
MNKQKFEDYIHSGNVPGSGKASSYVRALDLRSEMLKAHPMGFADCQQIWSVNSTERIESLYRLALAESKKETKVNGTFQVYQRVICKMGTVVLH